MILCFPAFTSIFSFNPNPCATTRAISAFTRWPLVWSSCHHLILGRPKTDHCFSTNHILMSRLETFMSPLSESSFLLPKPVAPLPCALSCAPLLPPFSLLCFSPSPPLSQFTPWGQMDLAEAYAHHYSVSPCCLQNPNSKAGLLGLSKACPCLHFQGSFPQHPFMSNWIIP